MHFAKALFANKTRRSVTISPLAMGKIVDSGRKDHPIISSNNGKRGQNPNEHWQLKAKGGGKSTSFECASMHTSI
jgi:hypothetical protein